MEEAGSLSGVGGGGEERETNGWPLSHPTNWGAVVATGTNRKAAHVAMRRGGMERWRKRLDRNANIPVPAPSRPERKTTSSRNRAAQRLGGVMSMMASGGVPCAEDTRSSHEVAVDLTGFRIP